MTKVTPGSAVFLDQQFPVDPEDFDFDDQRIIVIKSDPMVLPIKNIVDNYKLSTAPIQFQRPESWTPKEKKLFWLSLLMNRIEGVIVLVDIAAALHRIQELNPHDRAIQLYEYLLKKGFEYIVLDGNNRLKFLQNLFNDEWVIPEGNYEYIRDLNDSSTTSFRVTRKKNKFSDLPGAVKATLNRRRCIISEYTQIGYTGLSDIFTNTNSGVFPNPQELRNAKNTLWADFVRHLDKILTNSGLLTKVFSDPTKRFCGQDWITECLNFALEAVEETQDPETNEISVEFFPINQTSKNTLYKSTFLSKGQQDGYIQLFKDVSQHILEMIDDNVLEENLLKRKSTVLNLFWMMCNGIQTYDEAVEAMKLYDEEYNRKDKFFTDVYEYAENEEVVGDDLTFKNSCEGTRKINIEHRYLILSDIIRRVKKGFYSDVSGVRVGTELLS